MRRRWICVLLAAAMTMSVLAGCGSSEKESDAQSDSSAEETEDAAEESESTEKTVVKFQTWNPSENNGVTEVIEAFEKENPDIEIEYVYAPSGDHIEKLKVDLAAGDLADVYGLQVGTVYEEFREYQLDLTDYQVETYGENWQDEYVGTALDALEVDGSYYGLPLGVSYAGFVWADMEIMNKYGLEVPTSLEELKAVCQTLRDNGEYPLTIGAKDSWINIDTWMSIANDINSEKLYSALEGETSFTDADLVQSFEIWQSLFLDGIFQDGALGVNVYNDTKDLYEKEGSIPLFLNGSWQMNSYLNTDEETYAVFNSENSDHEVLLIDWNNDGTVSPITASADVVLCVNKDTKVKDAALRFVDYMVHEGQDWFVNQRYAYSPSRTDLVLDVQGLSEDGKENLDYIMEQVNSNIAGYREMSYPELKQAIADNLTNLALGEVTPEEAAELIEAASQAQER